MRFLPPPSAGDAPSALGGASIPPPRIPAECASVAVGYEYRAMLAPCAGLANLESENWLELGEKSGRWPNPDMLEFINWKDW